MKTYLTRLTALTVLLFSQTGFSQDETGWVESTELYKTCEEIQKKKFGEPATLEAKKAYLDSLLNCKRVALKEETTKSRYHVFYNKCKELRLRQAAAIGPKESERRLKYCKEWAEQYELSTQKPGLQICELKSCHEGKAVTSCENEYRIVGPIGVRPCRTVYAALSCMEPMSDSTYPTKVHWRTESREGHIECGKI